MTARDMIETYNIHVVVGEPMRIGDLDRAQCWPYTTFHTQEF